MTRDLQNTRMLRRVLEAKYASRLAAFQRIVQREQSLRTSLLELQQRARDTQIATPEDMKLIGADVIWQSWIEKKSRQLNMELAQVLVQKEQDMYQLRKDFGKKHAGAEVERLLVAAQREKRNKNRDTELMSHLAQTIVDRRKS